MTTYAYTDAALDTNMNARILRAVLGMTAVGAVLAGYWLQPLWIFVLAAASVYLVTTAIIGEGLADALFRMAGGPRTTPVSEYNNVFSSERVARGATAGATLGSVISGILLLDPVDIFALNVVGFYTGMTAIMAWDPLYGLFRREPRYQSPAFSAVTPAAKVRVGRVADIQSDARKHAA